MRVQQHLHFIENPVPAQALFAFGEAAGDIAVDRLLQSDGANLWRFWGLRYLHVPAPRMRRVKNETLCLELAIERSGQFARFILGDLQGFRGKQDQTVVVHAEMHRVGAQPVPGTGVSAIPGKGKRRDRPVHLLLNAEAPAQPGGFVFAHAIGRGAAAQERFQRWQPQSGRGNRVGRLGPEQGRNKQSDGAHGRGGWNCAESSTRDRNCRRWRLEGCLVIRAGMWQTARRQPTTP